MAFMLPVNLSNGNLKRHRSDSSDQLNGQYLKKQRQYSDSYHPDHWVASQRFWETLPKIYLTRRALTEHNRRNRAKDLRVKVLQKTFPPRRRSARLQSACAKQTSAPLSVNTREAGLELQRFARHGGPDLTSLRGFPDPIMSDRTSRISKRTSGSGVTTSSKRSGPYDANYQLKLAQAGIFLTEQVDENDDIILPSNYDDITARLSVPRPSLSPSRFTEKDFQKFRRQHQQEVLESETMQKSMTVIEGNGRENEIYTRVGGPFNNLKPFDQDLAMAMPDSYDGAQPLSIDHRVLRDLNEYIVPNTDTTRPAAPNFFLEVKSPSGRTDVAKRQATQLGAYGVQAMEVLQSYSSQTPTYDGNAYSFTNTYHDGQLKMYACHATAPKTADGTPQYYTTQLNTYAMTGNSKTFREGATAYRNARYLAKEYRDKFIQQANQMAQQLPSSKHRNRGHSTTNTISTCISNHTEVVDQSHDSETSTDELALDKVLKRSRKAAFYDKGESDTRARNLTMSTPSHNNQERPITTQVETTSQDL